MRWYRMWRCMPIPAWIKAAQCFRREDFIKAIRLYDEGLNRNPVHPAADSARFDLAYCHYRLDQFGSALAALRPLIKKEAQIRDAYLLFGRILQVLGRASSAAEVLEKALRLFPGDSLVLAALLQAALESSFSISRIKRIRHKVLSAKADSQTDSKYQSHMEAALARYEFCFGNEYTAQRLLTGVLSSESVCFEGVLLYGERLVASGNIEQGRQQLERALKLSPRDPRPFQQLALSYLYPNDDYQPARAVSLAEAACRASHWQNSAALSILAAACEANGEKAKAQLFYALRNKLPSIMELRVFEVPESAHVRAAV